jgi:hypothetical protein
MAKKTRPKFRMAGRTEKKVVKFRQQLDHWVGKLHDEDPVMRSRARDFIFGEFLKQFGYPYKPSPLSLCRPRRKQRGAK